MHRASGDYVPYNWMLQSCFATVYLAQEGVEVAIE